MAINFPITSWFASLLLLLVAAGLGALARWLSARFGAKDWFCFFAGLFVFGLVILFFKVS
jgi:hypothetical protein